MNHKELDFAYESLLLVRQKNNEPTLEQWVIFSRYARFDPRLAEIWVCAMERAWRGIAPVLLNQENLKKPASSVMAVLLEHVELLIQDQTARKRFRLWKELASFETPKANHEQFFIGVRGFATEQVRQAAGKSLKVYQKWGFIGDEVLMNKFLQHQEEKPRTYLDAKTRKSILSALLKKKSAITVEDYISACGGAISPRSAQLDLKNEPKLKQAGQTRARIYHFA